MKKLFIISLLFIHILTTLSMDNRKISTAPNRAVSQPISIPLSTRELSGAQEIDDTTWPQYKYKNYANTTKRAQSSSHQPQSPPLSFEAQPVKKPHTKGHLTDLLALSMTENVGSNEQNTRAAPVVGDRPDHDDSQKQALPRIKAIQDPLQWENNASSSYLEDAYNEEPHSAIVRYSNLIVMKVITMRNKENAL